MLTRGRRGAGEWVLADPARRAFGQAESGNLATVGIREWIEAKLSSGEGIIAREAAEELGVGRSEITEILRHLRSLGRAVIDPEGPRRGPGTRWIAD